MENEIQSLQETIDASGEPTNAVVDAMNRLAVLQLDLDPSVSFETSGKAIGISRSIHYQQGEAQALFNAGIASSRHQEHDKAKAYFKLALDIRQLLNDEKGVADANARLGNANLHSGKYDEALEHYRVAIEIRTGLGDELGAAELFNNSGTIYLMQGNYALALKSLLTALKTFEIVKNSARIANASSNIGLIYYEQQNYDEALQMFMGSLAIYEKGKDLKEVSKTLSSIGNIYQEQGKYNDAIETHTNALHLREQIGDKSKVAISCHNLGNAYKELGEFKTARGYYIRSMAYYRDIHNKRDQLLLHIDLGELYFKTGELEEARAYLNEGIALAQENGLKAPLRKAYEILAKLFAKEENYEEAFKYLSQYTQLDKEISNIETNRQIAQMTVMHELEQKERDAESERLKNAELQRAYASLEEEKKRSEGLLNNILPEEISEELKQSGKTKARSFESVTVMFADIQNFTKISEQLTAEELVSGIDEYFEAFDKIVEKYSVEKIKTIGDAYLCVGGVPIAMENHAELVIKAALEFLEAAKTLNRKRGNENKGTFDFRIGVHSGPVVAGVVGIKKFAYDIWGDTVNTASRMQQNSVPNQINISESTYRLIQHRFQCTYRGEIEAKNKGKLKMYFIT